LYHAVGSCEQANGYRVTERRAIVKLIEAKAET